MSIAKSARSNARAYELRGLLLGLPALDPVTFGIVSVVLIGAVLAASYLPGRQAARMDPVTTLRNE